MVSTMGNSPPHREPPGLPPPAVIQAEQQWLFTEAELAQAPSIIDGIPLEAEQLLRRKGATFISQVGIMLKLPQTTQSTATVFFNRYLMRMSLKPSPGYKPLHHYQIAATALFLATKADETCRKMKEIVVACVRVALKDPNKLVDEQTKDFWKWRDTILYSEDLLLETLCFDIHVESPFKMMYEMMKYFGVEHNKKLRDSAWAFLSDSTYTPMCLLFPSHTIAAASLYAGARLSKTEIGEDGGRPWWDVQHVKLGDVVKACNLMADFYEKPPDKDGSVEYSIYADLRTPEDGLEEGSPQSVEGVQCTSIEKTQNGTGAATERGSEEGELDG